VKTVPRSLTSKCLCIVEWLKNKREGSVFFEKQPAEWLDKRLAKFYKSETLGHDLLKEFRRSLSLYLSSYSFSKNVTISIGLDPEYTKSNTVLSNLLANKGSDNNSTSDSDSAQSDPIYPISDADMTAMYATNTLSEFNPLTLSFKAWFDVTYHLCNGNVPPTFWRTLNKHDLIFTSDIEGVYFTFSPNLIFRGGGSGRMYATPDYPDRCPVKSTSWYLSLLNDKCESFFQSPNRSWKPGNNDWYKPLTIKQEHLDNMMESISLIANLSRIYTNTSVILTAKLKKDGTA